MQKIFLLDREIYREEFLNQSIEDFSGVTKIDFQDDTLTIDGESTTQIDEIFNEFMNYSLSLILNNYGLGL